MTKLEYGQAVKCSVKLERRWGKNHFKYWNPVESKFTGIFLGLRTLYDGQVHFGDYEESVTFTRKRSFVAALVSPGERLNPVYVPLEAIEAWNQRARQESPWIPVSERLPDVGQRVIGLCGKNMDFYSFEFFENEPCWVLENDSCDLDMDYWMPIHEVPNETG